VGFVVDKVALGQDFSEYFGFPCQSLFHQFLVPGFFTSQRLHEEFGELLLSALGTPSSALHSGYMKRNGGHSKQRKAFVQIVT
jgi:hypothetical protein